MARCPEASSFMNSQENEKIKVKKIKHQVFIKPFSQEPLLTCKYHLPQDIQFFLTFQFYFSILNLRLLLDLIHKVTY